MSTAYLGANGNAIRHGGGSVRVTMAANVGQGNGGTSLPCAGCWVSAPSGNTAPTKFNIGAAASATLGVEIAEGVTALWIPIDDVAQLYFYTGGATDVVDITYLKG
jgi:hypothetical protein